MTTDRIKEIQECTAYPSSKSVQLALLQVWNECEQQSQSEIDELTKEVERLNSQLAKIYMYAEQMSLDLLESSEFIEGSYESLANYKNHIQSINP